MIEQDLLIVFDFDQAVYDRYFKHLLIKIIRHLKI